MVGSSDIPFLVKIGCIDVFKSLICLLDVGEGLMVDVRLSLCFHVIKHQ